MGVIYKTSTNKIELGLGSWNSSYYGRCVSEYTRDNWIIREFMENLSNPV